MGPSWLSGLPDTPQAPPKKWVSEKIEASSQTKHKKLRPTIHTQKLWHPKQTQKYETEACSIILGIIWAACLKRSPSHTYSLSHACRGRDHKTFFKSWRKSLWGHFIAGITSPQFCWDSQLESVDIGGWYGIMKMALKTDCIPILIILIWYSALSLIEPLLQQKKR